MIKFNKYTIRDNIIDCHTHSGGVYFYNYFNGLYPYFLDIKTLSDIIKSNGIDYAITFPVPTTVYYNYNEYININRFVDNHVYNFPFEVENNTLLEQIQ
ncbi:MAG: hypothetical protein LBU84_03800, partial [Prevotella sp.]|nr:hypothetical protein [Prevotella sp.]